MGDSGNGLACEVNGRFELTGVESAIKEGFHAKKVVFIDVWLVLKWINEQIAEDKKHK